MHADDLVGIDMPQSGRNKRANIAALRGKAIIAQPRHQLHPKVRHSVEEHALGRQRTGKGKTRKRRRDHVKGIRRIATIGRWIGQWTDDFLHIPECPWPAVIDDERGGRRSAYNPLPLHMDEMDGNIVDHRAEMRKGIHRGFVGAPVVVVDPIIDQFAHIGEVGSGLPIAVVANFLRPAGARQPLRQVIQIGLRNVDVKGMDSVGHLKILREQNDKGPLLKRRAAPVTWR